jgi:heme-degrading monooxygenase HmoA
MSDRERRIIVFRTRLNDGVDDEYAREAERIAGIAVRARGFGDAKDFVADDGERVAIIEWDGADALSAWREHAEHAAAQRAGRERFYASYQLQVCAELRASRFDAATGEHVHRDRDPARVRGIAEAWLDCFARRDLDGLLALYADDATHSSPKIRARHAETDGKLHGKVALRAWWQDAFARLPTMRYEPTAITADDRRVVMEYVRRVDGEPDLAVAETLDVEGGRIVASRVFHG